MNRYRIEYSLILLLPLIAALIGVILAEEPDRAGYQPSRYLLLISEMSTVSICSGFM